MSDHQCNSLMDLINLKTQKEPPWSAEVWEKARNGTLPPTRPRRFPVLLTPDGPISSPGELQKLAETASLPEAVVTSQVDENGQEIRKVTICQVNYDERKRIEEKADVGFGVAENFKVLFNGNVRQALVVKRLKEGAAARDEDKEEDKNEDEEAR
ncbi:b02f80e8-5820-4240-9f51-3986cd7e4032 [Thermothielavioides terrestris]|uniref:B02f80e8-5820-4240-9f51-3986cd7e4032 n=1 Tax=Thermothielavioides terrestris TaxID=2587410 RepID=A0A3S4AVB7_9PEZI|nr:b02f80e8-5820-4240-9f51-3986cd7e4032 [Thermothielavioides terrestris]